MILKTYYVAFIFLDKNETKIKTDLKSWKM